MRETPGAPESEPAVAFTAVLQRFQWPVFAFLRSFVAHDEQARDLTQDVFADAWRATLRAAPPFAALARLSADAAKTPTEGEDDTIRRWLFHTAYCRAISALRRRRLIRWESLDARPNASGAVGHGAVAENAGWAEPFAESFEERVVESQALNAALAALAPADVACLVLSVVHGFTTAEIAQVIEVNAEAAKKRLTRAKQRLRAAYLAQNRPTPGVSTPVQRDGDGPHAASPTRPTRDDDRVRKDWRS